jgi:hypothetical protein
MTPDSQRLRLVIGGSQTLRQSLRLTAASRQAVNACGIKLHTEAPLPLPRASKARTRWLATCCRHVSDQEVSALRRTRHRPRLALEGLSKKGEIACKQLPYTMKAAVLLSHCGCDTHLRVLPVQPRPSLSASSTSMNGPLELRASASIWAGAHNESKASTAISASTPSTATKQPRYTATKATQVQSRRQDQT